MHFNNAGTFGSLSQVCRFDVLLILVVTLQECNEWFSCSFTCCVLGGFF